MFFIKLIFCILYNYVLLEEIQKIYYSNHLVENLIKKNQQLFQNNDTKLDEPIYLTKSLFQNKINIHILLHFLYFINLNFNKNINEIILSSENNYYGSNNNNHSNRILLDNIWFDFCHYRPTECLQLCKFNDYKTRWCHSFHDSRHIYKRNLITYNFTNKILINEIVEDLVQKNLQNSFVYMNSLFDESSSNMKCKYGFVKILNKCHDINECNSSGLCDKNADCINTYGSFKCKCRKGYLGNGVVDSCFSGKFCSGKFCRLNGECVFRRNLGGYKCKCMLNCLNGGICKMNRFKYECKCPVFTTGYLCNETINDYSAKKNYNFTNSNESLKLNQIINLVEPTSNFLNKSLFDSIIFNGLKENTRILYKNQKTSLIKPFYNYNEDDLDYNYYY
jgi:hypothetical protein